MVNLTAQIEHLDRLTALAEQAQTPRIRELIGEAVGMVLSDDELFREFMESCLRERKEVSTMR